MDNDSKSIVRRLIETHPLALVLSVAIVARLVAVIWSRGFIHSDDFFDTVQVAYDWLTGGFWGPDGYLRWKNRLSDTIGRFPLYAMSLWAIMKFCWLVGIKWLNSMMYAVRSLHALVSLIPVVAAYRIVLMVTGLRRWAVLGGLMTALHFAFPFLGVRSLIEVVGGDIWMAAILCFYLYHRDYKLRWLHLAGIIAGLAWMVRFQIAFAVIPVPFVLWYEARRLRPALHFSGAVAFMLLLSGFADWILLGRFAGSTITNLSMNVGLPALYGTIPMMYPILLLLLFIPPFSFVLAYLIFRPVMLRRHRLLLTSAVFFLVGHMLLANQQERFIFPILPKLLLLGVLAMWEKYREYGYILRPKYLFPAIASFAGVVNLVLLFPLTVAYGHRGMIEPLLWFEKHAPTASVLFVQPGVKRWVPVEYAGQSFRPSFVRDWANWNARAAHSGRFDYFVLYPKEKSDLAQLKDSVITRYGPLEEVLHVTPSLYDETLHLLNPSHNDDFEAFVYRPRSGTSSEATLPGRSSQSLVINSP